MKTIVNGYTYTVNEETKTVLVEGTVQHVASRWLDAAENGPKTGSYIDYHDSCMIKDGGSEPEFYGEFSTALKAIKDNVFERPHLNLNKHLKDLKAKIVLEDNGKRKRAVDSREGEYDFDRQFDVNPFYSSKRVETEVKYIDVEIDLSINGGTSAEEIKSYGETCYAAIAALENAGYRCNVYLTKSSSGRFHKGKYSSYQFDSRFKLKSADEYQSISAYAKYLTAWFYRRCIFNQQVESGEFAKCAISYGLGRSVTQQCEASLGRIKLTPSISVEQRTDLAPLLHLLYQATGKTGSKKAA